MAEPIKTSPSKIIDKVKAGAKKVRVETLVEKIYEAFGGETAFAQALHDEFKAAPQGGITRARIATTIVQMTSLVSKRDVGTPLDDVSEADIDREMLELHQLAMQAIPTIVEATPDVTPPNQP